MTKKPNKSRTPRLEKKYKDDPLTLEAVRARRAFRQGDEKMLEEHISSIAYTMKPKWNRLHEKLEDRQIRSPFDPKYHEIGDLTPWNFLEDFWKQNIHLEILRAVIRDYRPSRGAFLPYANKMIYFFFLKAFKRWLMRNLDDCQPLREGIVNKSKYFKQVRYLSETSVQNKLRKAFLTLPIKQANVCLGHYLSHYKTGHLIKWLEIKPSTLRVLKKNALDTLKKTHADVYEICKKYDKL